MTNAEKFTEVFGVEPDTDSMAINCPDMVKAHRLCKYQGSMGACHCEDWWQEEYKERRE